MTYQKPCNSIHSVLGNFAKVSGEHMPYSLFKINKTTAFAYCLPVDRPLVSVQLNAKSGSKDLFLVSSSTSLNTISTVKFSLALL